MFVKKCYAGAITDTKNKGKLEPARDEKFFNQRKYIKVILKTAELLVTTVRYGIGNYFFKGRTGRERLNKIGIEQNP